MNNRKKNVICKWVLPASVLLSPILIYGVSRFVSERRT